MLNIKKNNKNQVEITYKNSGKVETIVKKYTKPLFKKVKGTGAYTDLKGNSHYELDKTGGVYPYACFQQDGNYDKGVYFNTLINLSDEFINELEFPKMVFYDIETNNKSIPVKKKGNKYFEAPATARINSIAWIDENNNEHCLIAGKDGTERDILKGFVEYLEKNNIMSLVGHNSYEFDNIIVRDRLKRHGLNNELFKKASNQCNLDTLKLSKTLNYSNKMISLNDLANLLGVNESKSDLGIYNPVTAYDEAIKSNDFKEFEEYNIQDVRLTKKVFEQMGVKDTLTELFKLTLCPFTNINSVVQLLNYYTCRNLYKDKILIPTISNDKIKAVNRGGFNYIEKENELLRYKDVSIYDVVSYYPNLFRLIKANNLEPYSNFNTQSGELKPFKENLKGGYLDKIATNLYFKRIEVKELMKNEKDKLRKQQLDSKQQTLKIIVNGLYGACDSNYNYILGSHKVSTIITAIGRNLLQNILQDFKGVYAKTDSIFIKTTDSEATLKAINDYTTMFLKETYNLNNIDKNNEPIIRFELDDEVQELIIKSKNEYIKKYENTDYKVKGGSFTGDNKSNFEKDLIHEFIISKSDNNVSVKDVLDFTDKAIKTNTIDYFSFRYKLSSKTPKDKRAKGRAFMTKKSIPFTWNFKYNAVRVESKIYDWILYPAGYTNVKNLKVSRHYAYFLALNLLKLNNLISEKEFQKYMKNKKLHGLKSSINQYNSKKSKLIKDLEDNMTLNDDYLRETYKQVQETEKRDYNTPAVNNSKSVKLEQLKKLIPDTEDYIKNDTIKIVPHLPDRSPNYDKMKNYLKVHPFNNKKHMPLIPSGKLISGNENIGIATGYKNLKCLDIDGAKKKLTKKQNIQLCKELKNILTSTDIPFIIQKTKSKGYHLFYVSKEDFNFNGFKFPKDYHIQELQGHEFGTNTIEVFDIKPVPLAPSEVKGEGKYVIEPNKYTWNSIFNSKTTNIFDIIKDAFIKQGYTYEPPKIIEANTNYTSNIEVVELSEKELKTIMENSIKIIKESNKQKGKRNTIAQALGGYLSKRINKETGQVIQNAILEKVHYDEINEHMNSFIENWDRSVEEKTGMNKIRNSFNNSKKIKTLTSNITRIFNKYELKNTPKLETLSQSEKIYKYYNDTEGSFLTTDKPVKYDIPKNYEYDLKNLENELINHFKDKETQELARQFINGGYAHFKLKKVSEFKTDDLKITENGSIYGFPSLIKLDEDNKEFTGKVERIKKILKQSTVLNPTFFMCKGFTQMRNELLKGKDTILYASFENIQGVKIFNPALKKGFVNTSRFFFKLHDIEGNILTYDNVTIKELVSQLIDRALTPKSNKQLETIIISFINELKKKQGIDYKKIPVCSGFFYNNEEHEVVSYLPDIKTCYSLDDGLEVLNLIITDVFKEKSKYVTIIKEYLLMSIKNILIEFNLHNGINKHMFLLETKGTLKTTSLQIANSIFEYKDRLVEARGGDTVSAIARSLNESTLPLINDDPQISVNDPAFQDISRSSAYSYEVQVLAKEQYGNEKNIRHAFRLLAMTTNDTNMRVSNDKSGLLRRLNATIFTKDDELKEKDERKKVLTHLTSKVNGEMKLNRLNALGLEFESYIHEYFNNMTHEKETEIKETSGHNIIDDFFKQLENKSQVELNPVVYEWYKHDNIEANETEELQNIFINHFVKTLEKYRYGKIEFDIPAIDFYIDRVNFITKRENKTTHELEIFILQSELLGFLKSSDGANRTITAKQFLEVLGIKDSFIPRLTYEKDSTQYKAIKITREEIKEKLYGIYDNI